MAAAKVVITGAGGQLGRAFQSAAGSQDNALQLFLFDRHELDITQVEATRHSLTSLRPDYVINCAAYTAVERAETEPEAALLLNATAVGNLSAVCREIGARLVHFSTDYVFDGQKHTPYSEHDTTNPLSVYGRTKWQGEEAVRHSGCDHFIFRTAWIFSPFGENFVTKMLRFGAEKPQLQVVSDQQGSPTYAIDLAEMVLCVLQKDRQQPFPSGTYHLTNANSATWHQLAQKTLELAGIDTPVLPVSTDFFPSKVHRPAYSVLDISLFKNTFGIAPRTWEDALAHCISQRNKN